MKLNKFISGLICVAAISLTSCYDEEGGDYTPATPDAGAYIYADATTKMYSPNDDFVLTISLGRTNDSEASTVNLTSDNDAFNVPSSVSFAVGEKIKEVQIPFDMEVATTEKVTITIPEGVTVYGNSSLTFTITVDYNWISAGTCTFIDNTFSDNGASANGVPIQQAEGTNLYRIIRPFIAVWGNNPAEGFISDSGIQFTMNDDFTIDFVAGDDDTICNVADAESQYSFCWVTSYVGTYCKINCENNYYETEMLGLIDGEGYYTGFAFAFEWTTGWPGQ